MKSLKVFLVSFCLLTAHSLLPMLANVIKRQSSNIAQSQKTKSNFAKFAMGGAAGTFSYACYTAHKNDYDVNATQQALQSDAKKLITDIKKEYSPFTNYSEIDMEYYDEGNLNAKTTSKEDSK